VSLQKSSDKIPSGCTPGCTASLFRNTLHNFDIRFLQVEAIAQLQWLQAIAAWGFCLASKQEMTFTNTLIFFKKIRISPKLINCINVITLQ
jgi:hypothetical protein